MSDAIDRAECVAALSRVREYLKTCERTDTEPDLDIPDVWSVVRLAELACRFLEITEALP